MPKNFLKRAGLFVLTLAFAFVPVANVGATADGTGRYVTITMHAGEYGHFDEGDPESHTKTFFYADAFNDHTEPVSSRDGYVFIGWSTSPEVTSVNVEVGETKAGNIGSDLYAVWSDKAYVYYEIYNGVWTNPDTGDDYTSVIMEYNVGATFQNLSVDPRPLENVYDFAGWNSNYYSAGTHYIPGETVINDYWTEVRVEWDYNAERIEDELEVVGEGEEVEKEKDVSVGLRIPVYKFTAPETATYEIYTSGVEVDPEAPEEEQYEPIIRLRDINDNSLAIEKYVDPDKDHTDLDVHLFYEMTAGETYYIRFGENHSYPLTFKAGVKKATMANVTYDANRGSDAWFDGDHSKTTKIIPTPIGEDIFNIRLYGEGLEYDGDKVSPGAWYDTPDPTGDEHNYLIVTGDMTVYADYTEMVAINLDFNGGYHPYEKDMTSMPATFPNWAKFESPIDPDIDDPTKDFAGWSRNKNATKPDPDIIEGKTQATELDGETLYAVYGEKVLTTFVTEGGAYMLDDPDVTTFESPRGNGHIFYGMMVMNPYGDRVKHVGWIDNKGEIINTTSDIDGYYHINGDTTFTALLRYKITAKGNGGHFTVGCGWGGACETGYPEISFRDEDSTFSYAEAKEFAGIPVSDEEGKYFIGYATTEDAEEPDIIDGETKLLDLSVIYAVWGDEYPAYLDDDSEITYEKDSEEGLHIIVHRADDDAKTFSSFSGLTMDNAYDYDEDCVINLPEDVYDAREGSLILDLHANYLDTLDAGEHTLAVHFNDIDDLNIALTITEPEAPATPNTGANSISSDSAATSSYLVLALGISLVVFFLGRVVLKKL